MCPPVIVLSIFFYGSSPFHLRIYIIIIRVCSGRAEKKEEKVKEKDTRTVEAATIYFAAFRRARLAGIKRQQDAAPKLYGLCGVFVIEKGKWKWMVTAYVFGSSRSTEEIFLLFFFLFLPIDDNDGTKKNKWSEKRTSVCAATIYNEYIDGGTANYLSEESNTENRVSKRFVWSEDRSRFELRFTHVN